MSDGGLVILTFTLGIVVWPAIIAGLCRVLRWSSADQPTFAGGHCAMEVVAWLAGEGHTDPAVTR